MLGEGSELWREGGEREEEEGRKKRGTRNPLNRWKPHLPKPLHLAGAPPPPRELSSHRHTYLGGGPCFMEQQKSSFSLTLLL